MSANTEVPRWAMYWGMIAAVMLSGWLASSVYADVQTLKIQQAVVEARLDLILEKVTRIEASLEEGKR